MERKEMIKHINELHKEVRTELGDKKITKREFGILVYKKWRFEALHGHTKIGKIIIKRYNMTPEDVKETKRERKNTYERYYTKLPQVKERRNLRDRDMRRVYKEHLKQEEGGKE